MDIWTDVGQIDRMTILAEKKKRLERKPLLRGLKKLSRLQILYTSQVRSKIIMFTFQPFQHWPRSCYGYLLSTTSITPDGYHCISVTWWLGIEASRSSLRIPRRQVCGKQDWKQVFRYGNRLVPWIEQCSCKRFRWSNWLMETLLHGGDGSSS